MGENERLICVDDSVEVGFLEQKNKFFQQWVVKDKIYTLRQFLNNDDIVEGILLNEVVNRPIYQKLLNRYQEPGFRASRFRKLSPDEVYMLSLEEDFEEIDELVKVLVV